MSFFIKVTKYIIQDNPRLVGRVKSTFGREEMCVAEVSAGQVGEVTTMSTGPTLEGEMHLSDDDGCLLFGQIGPSLNTWGWTLSFRHIFYEENQPLA